jgi:hypothetical protein
MRLMSGILALAQGCGRADADGVEFGDGFELGGGAQFAGFHMR